MESTTQRLLESLRTEIASASKAFPQRAYPRAETLLGWFQDRKKAIRDPIYDQIRLNELERSVLRTAEFQRLRWVKQMDFAYLVYPAAEHSRFIHSLGVCQASKDLFDKISSNYQERVLSRMSAEGVAEDRPGIARFCHFDRVLVSLAALLHDLCHPPFSHAFDIRDDLLEHDDYEKNPFMIRALFDTSVSQLARVLDSWDPYFQVLVRAEAPQQFSSMAQVAEGSRPGIPSLAALAFEILSIKATDDLGASYSCICPGPTKEPASAEQLTDIVRAGWRQSPLTFTTLSVNTSTLFRRLHCDIVANTISADLMDYIRRDTRVAGLPRDLDRRFFSYISSGSYRGRDRVVVELEDRQGHVRRDVLSDLMNCMEIRYIIHERIVLHRAVVAARAMAARLRPPNANSAASAWSTVEEMYGKWNHWFADAELLGDHSQQDGLNKSLASLLRSRSLYRPIVILDAERVRRHNVTLTDDAKERLGRKFGAQVSRGASSSQGHRLWGQLHALETTVNEEALKELDAVSRKAVSDALGDAPATFAVCMKPSVLFKNPRILVSVPTSLVRDTSLDQRQIQVFDEWLSQVIPLSAHEADQGIYAQIRALHIRYGELWRLYIFAHPALFEFDVGQVVLLRLKEKWETLISADAGFPAMPPNTRAEDLRSQDAIRQLQPPQGPEILRLGMRLFPQLNLMEASRVLDQASVAKSTLLERIQQAAREDYSVAAKGGLPAQSEIEALENFRNCLFTQESAADADGNKEEKIDNESSAQGELFK